jgi:hypothetical protein
VTEASAAAWQGGRFAAAVVVGPVAVVALPAEPEPDAVVVAPPDEPPDPPEQAAAVTRSAAARTRALRVT